jgi:hypothetical protein
VIEQGGTGQVAFDTVDGRIDSMIKTVLFFQCTSSPYRETTKEQ